MRNGPGVREKPKRVRTRRTVQPRLSSRTFGKSGMRSGFSIRYSSCAIDFFWMPIFYRDIADRRIARLANLSDSIFGVAMTLLVLELRVPVDYIKTEREL